RPLDQPGVDLGPGRSEAEVVVAPSDLDRFVRTEEPADLLERFRWDDEIRLAARALERHIHPGETMAVRRHHPHPVAPELPQNTVQNRTALFRARRERHMTNQLLEIFRGDFPSAVEFHRRKGRKLVAGESEELEPRAPTLDLHPLLTGAGEPNRRARKL